MHLKSLVILCCSLAAFASTIDVPNAAGTVNNIVEGVDGVVFNVVKKVVDSTVAPTPSPRQCTNEERRKIERVKADLQRLERIVRVDEETKINEYVLRLAKKKVDPTACKELQDVQYRMVMIMTRMGVLYGNGQAMP